MIFISHRGNLNGEEPLYENNPNYILEAINHGYECEIDVWRVDGSWMLGHDAPQYQIGETFLTMKQLWCHAKNLHALDNLLKIGAHCFWHQEDDYTITSKGVIWAYPGKKLLDTAICVMPERYAEIYREKTNCAGICSDYIQRYRTTYD